MFTTDYKHPPTAQLYLCETLKCNRTSSLPLSFRLNAELPDYVSHHIQQISSGQVSKNQKGMLVDIGSNGSYISSLLLVAHGKLMNPISKNEMSTLKENTAPIQSQVMSQDINGDGLIEVARTSSLLLNDPKINALNYGGNVVIWFRWDRGRNLQKIRQMYVHQANGYSFTLPMSWQRQVPHRWQVLQIVSDLTHI